MKCLDCNATVDKRAQHIAKDGRFKEYCCYPCLMERFKKRYGSIKHGFLFQILVKINHKTTERTFILIEHLLDQIGGPEVIASMWKELLDQADKNDDFDLKLRALEATTYLLQIGDEFLMAYTAKKHPPKTEPFAPHRRGAGNWSAGGVLNDKFKPHGETP